ncbi:MAG: hypothetical protein AB8V04_01305 [Candidatus Midichloria sp.]
MAAAHGSISILNYLLSDPDSLSLLEINGDLPPLHVAAINNKLGTLN